MSVDSRSVRTLAALALALLALVPLPAAADEPDSIPESGTFIFLDSDVGEPILNGLDQSYTPAEADFFVDSTLGEHLSAIVRGDDGSVVGATFGAPTGQPLTIGTYEGAIGFPTPEQAHLRVFANSTGCNTVAGTFTVTEAEVISTVWVAFDATFEQFCDSFTVPLQGRIRWELPADTLPPSWLSLPPSWTVEAPDQEGAFVDYALPLATDDVDSSPAVACDPPPRSLFPVGTTVVKCVARDFSGNETDGSFDMIVLEPLNLQLALNRRVQLIRQSGAVVALMTVRCARDAFAQVQYHLEQIGRSEVVSATASLTVFCTAPSELVTLLLVPETGKFRTGGAAASATAFNCNYLCWNAEVSQSVRVTR